MLLKDEELTPIYVPEPDDEAIRDLSCARERAMNDLKDAKCQLKALFLRNHIQCKVKDNGSWELIQKVIQALTSKFQCHFSILSNFTSSMPKACAPSFGVACLCLLV